MADQDKQIRRYYSNVVEDLVSSKKLRKTKPDNSAELREARLDGVRQALKIVQESHTCLQAEVNIYALLTKLS
jgi:hypothetical protein